MNGTHLSWITPTLPQLVAPPEPQIPPNAVHMTPGLMNLAIFMGEFTTPSLIPLATPTLLNTNMLSKLNPLILRNSGPILAGSTNIPLRKPSTKPHNGLLPPLGILCGSISSPDSQLSTSLGDLKRLLLIPSSQTPLPLTLVLPWPRVVLASEL